MDTFEAARLLGVADSEIVEVRDVGGRFEVLHHDMASHEETWRPLPEPADVEPHIDEPPVVAEKPAPKRRNAR